MIACILCVYNSLFERTECITHVYLILFLVFRYFSMVHFQHNGILRSSYTLPNAFFFDHQSCSQPFPLVERFSFLLNLELDHFNVLNQKWHSTKTNSIFKRVSFVIRMLMFPLVIFVCFSTIFLEQFSSLWWFRYSRNLFTQRRVFALNFIFHLEITFSMQTF